MITSNQIIGSYDGLTLYGRDILTLQPLTWINASIIHFKLKKTKKELKIANLLNMDPLVASLINYENDEEDLAPLIDSTDVSKFPVMLLPLNDNMNPMQVNGGRHWTLLLLVKSEDKLLSFHFCSMGKKVPQSGLNIIGKICKFLKLKPDHTEIKTHYKQMNTYDCGLHAIFNGICAMKACKVFEEEEEFNENGEVKNIEDFLKQIFMIEEEVGKNFDASKLREEIFNEISSFCGPIE